MLRLHGIIQVAQKIPINEKHRHKKKHDELKLKSRTKSGRKYFSNNLIYNLDSI